MAMLELATLEIVLCCEGHSCYQYIISNHYKYGSMGSETVPTDSADAAMVAIFSQKYHLTRRHRDKFVIQHLLPSDVAGL